MAYTSKSGKTYANPAYGRMMDEAEQAEKKPVPGKPEAKKEDGPVIRIVIAQSPEGHLTSDNGKESSQHDDIESLLDHIRSTFVGGKDEDQNQSPAIADKSMPGPGIADSVAQMLK